MTFLTDDPLEEAKKIAREAFLVFEHREGSKVVDVRQDSERKKGTRWGNEGAVYFAHAGCPSPDRST